jgi:hypothetical protein
VTPILQFSANFQKFRGFFGNVFRDFADYNFSGSAEKIFLICYFQVVNQDGE